MIVSLVNPNITLLILCVMCALFIIGIAVTSALIAKAKKKFDKIANNDVYISQSGTLNGGIENQGDYKTEHVLNTTPDGSEFKSNDEVQDVEN